MDQEFSPAFFDNSSKAWMENKVRQGYQVLYRCEFIHPNRQICKSACSTSTSDYCLKHKRMEKQQEVKAEKKYNLRPRK